MEQRPLTCSMPRRAAATASLLLAKFTHNHIALDGLEDRLHDKGQAMAYSPIDTARKLQINHRDEQDKFAARVLTRAHQRAHQGRRLRKAEIASLIIMGKAGDTVISEDESPKKGKARKIPATPEAFVFHAGRHGHGGDIEFHFRRRGSAGAHA